MSEGSYTGKLRAPNLDMTRQWMTAISHAVRYCRCLWRHTMTMVAKLIRSVLPDCVMQCQMLEVATAPRDIASTARKQPSEGAERVRFESFSDMPDATPTPSLSSSQGPTSNSIMSQSTPALLGYTATSSSSAAAGGATPAPSTSAAAAASSSTPPSPTTSSEGSLVEVEPAYQWQRTQEEKVRIEWKGREGTGIRGLSHQAHESRVYSRRHSRTSFTSSRRPTSTTVKCSTNARCFASCVHAIWTLNERRSCCVTSSYVVLERRWSAESLTTPSSVVGRNGATPSSRTSL